VYARARGTLTRLSEPGRHGVPIWSPDGERLTYSSGHGGPDALRQIRADARSASELVIADNEHSLVPAAWTPDGRRLFYYTIPTVEAAPAALWVWDADLATNSTKTPTMSAGLSRDGGGIDVSPDGRWIAYHASDSGRPEVYVQAYPGSGPRYQVSTDGGISPIWRRDGRELFYLRPSSLGDSTNSAVLSVGNIRVMAVPVTPKPALALSAPRLLFEGPYDVNVPARSYDVTADGQRFLLLVAQKRPPDVITHMMVVQNWNEELKVRVPRP
jgi:Tol biopolymer transport system component